MSDQTQRPQHGLQDEDKIAAVWGALATMPGYLSAGEVRSRVIAALEPDWAAAMAKLQKLRALDSAS